MKVIRGQKVNIVFMNNCIHNCCIHVRCNRQQVCAAEMAVRYAALSVSLLFARWRQVTLQNGTHGTDGQTDRQSATQYAAPS